MAVIDGNPPLSNWQFRPIKLRAYEALHTLNRCFEATLLSFQHLEQLGVFRPEFLNGFKVTLEHTRARANEELIQSLQNYETEESRHFGELQDEWDKQFLDPDDVFFHVRDRKQEIKDQMRALQDGLKRQHPRRQKEKGKRRAK
ncbi:MAG TPA: hypothetical protein VKY85_14985 [Candidatus Angelobacter sp.]|nr:hypothetical protein [Candidatus Angelobacter sp.]